MNQRSGVVTAFVREIDAKQGRVTLEYRGIEAGMESTWAYVAGPMSGGKRGAMFMPEPGDEVLVAFENGKFENAYVVGFLWNGEQLAPSDKAYHRVIVTPGGHELRFEDKKNDTRVMLKSAGKHQLMLEDKMPSPHVQLKTKDGREVLLDDTAVVGKLRIKSKDHEILLDDNPGASRIEIKAGAAGAVTITLTASPVPAVAISVAGNTVGFSAAGATVTSPSAVTVTATGAATINATGAVSVTAGGAASVTAGGAVNVTAGAAVNVTAPAVNVASALTTFAGAIKATAVTTGALVIAP